ncbi:MAG: DUF4912 domain-containing protein [Desulfotomaculaceae bacterium]|nr:DUF4912 domain-containing protein [Desulfotomaculaceae bacterium]
MGDQILKKILPAGYHENILSLLIQSPRILYAYWELSPGLKSALSEKERVQIRLNTGVSSFCQAYDFDLNEKNYYFKDVQPGMSYNCEIGTLNEDNLFLPLLRSNTIFAPNDLPCNPTNKVNSPSSAIFSPKTGS